ncbi:MAG: 4-hydroxybenzoate octaprenyltransferase [Firmicutes bacterium]|nr:4-hydroxybenzoate octaprenyltransferase [Bacillota bacterium]
MVLNKFKLFLQMIKFEHTVFALPFAYVGALLVERQIPSTHDLIWITLAMIGARTAAMSLNRVIDRQIDAKNPRTRDRAIPKRILSVKEVLVYTFLSFGLLIISAYQLSTLAFQLFPIAVAILVLYSYTKRFTWTCHLFLGAALGLAPLGAWIAIAGSFHPAPILIGIGVAFWVAGFDIIYACDDREFDRQEGLYSIPAKFGIARALTVSSLCHIVAPAMFLLAGIFLDLGLAYMLGIILAIGILFYQHRLISPQDMSRAGLAFFNLNGILSILVFLCTLVEVL